MKKISIIYFLPLLVLLAASSCKKSFEDLTKNNNVPNNVPASLFFNGVLNNMVDLAGSSSEIYSQYYIYNYNYYGNNTYDFGSGQDYYTTLKNVLVMESQASASGGAAVNPYEALGKFFRAYLFSKMSMERGDIPMTQALQGLNNLTPKYDTQKAVMIQSLAWLESANADLAQLITNPSSGGTGLGATLSNDIFFNNSLAEWQKTVNAFRLRLLIQLSKKVTSDPDMHIAEQFAAIVGDPAKYPLMTSSADNLQYVYISPTNYYTQTPDNFGQNGSRQNMSATYVGLLTSLKDPRVFVTAEPARYNVDTLKQSPTAFSSFIGADPGLDLGVMYNNAGLQKYSFINRKHYYSTYTGEPSIQVGYPEQEFNIAEGINRGWATGNAETHYINGIQASMTYYGVPANGTFTAYFYRPGSTTGVKDDANYDKFLIATNWATYYAQPSVKYVAGDAGITEILQQKYLALFRHSGLESYYTYRRTHVPTFTTGPGTDNGQRIALRFQYPSSERSANGANYTAALASQYGGNDDINGVMWILK
ncbi:SusD/RagB family nutrient-binding outer membrane lipoprotein [Mucilaginibacter sp. BJC16-A38]|uniref:SusD/RagB family nutrient-binding outer membrane lipoprotein n=1 Tax=Mucilaginibacter phenanthrenivorans TaxID=1234842 RepID=UPI0021574FAA|nr:SusD/RagB family nutrient-binding outer membrane lipoprotein [Mucilaginibacter phenanthrenivorans]MCR8561086.1 SusD/RagB family nutrient-binding outer membrane lipoprotein [Mucilaginibacter phenanthrenivorans]